MAEFTYERKLVEQTIARSRKIMEETLELANNSENMQDASFPSYFTDGVKSTPFSPTEDSILAPIDNIWNQDTRQTSNYPLKISRQDFTPIPTASAVDELKREIAEETATSREQTQEISSLQSQLQKQEASNEAYLFEIGKLKQMVNSYENDINSLLKTKSGLASDIGELQDQISRLKSSHSNEVKRLKTRIQQLETNTTQVELAKAQAQIASLQAEYESQYSQVLQELAEQRQIYANHNRKRNNSYRPLRQRAKSSKRSRSFIAISTPTPNAKKQTTTQRTASRRTNRRKPIFK